MVVPRIAFIIDSLKLGGAERVLLRWASWCQEAGWQVLVITRHGPERDAYPLPVGVKRRQEPRLSAPLEKLGWFAFPLRVLQLRRLLVMEGCELAVGVTTLPAVKLLLACVGLPIRTVVSERNYPPAKPPALPWRWLRRLTYPRADVHLVQTRITGDWLRRHCAVRRQRLLPNPVVWPLPDRDPALNPDEWLAPGDPLILAVGTKAQQKGFDRLMPVFAELAHADPRLHLAVIGLSSGHYHGQNQQDWLRDRLGMDPDLQRRLLLPGVCGSMARWYSRATVFVLPSRYEGFPNVLLEAMAAGCACVASDCLTGPADLIRDGENGLLLPVDATASEWVMAIQALLRDPVRRSRLGAQAAAVRESFAEEGLRHDFLETLSRLHRNGLAHG